MPDNDRDCKNQTSENATRRPFHGKIFYALHCEGNLKWIYQLFQSPAIVAVDCDRPEKMPHDRHVQKGPLGPEGIINNSLQKRYRDYSYHIKNMIGRKMNIELFPHAAPYLGDHFRYFQ